MKTQPEIRPPSSEIRVGGTIKKGRGGKREGAGRKPNPRPIEASGAPAPLFAPPARRKAGPAPPTTCPPHIAPATKLWFEAVNKSFVLEEHHLRILRLACEAWDRGQQAREALAKAGALIYLDRFDAPHARPEIQIERDSRLNFARLVRELGLDDTEAPGATGGRRGKW